MLEIKSLTVELLPDVVDVYNRLTNFTPYCFPLTPDLFQTQVMAKKNFNSESCWLAYQAGKPAGYLHAGIIEKKEPPSPARHGSIYLFLADDREVAQALFRQAILFFKANKLKTYYAVAVHWSESNRFYGGIHMGIEVCLWRGFYIVRNVLQRAGADSICDGFIMSKRLDTMPEIEAPSADVTVRVEHAPDNNPLLANGKVTAWHEDRKAGGCYFSYLKELSRHLGKGIGQFTMGVDSSFRRKNIGTALLTRAHAELYQMGVRKMILATNYSLYPAICMYEKLGYRKEIIDLYSSFGNVES
jgi:GNAT superfamily N-acetyltransferase